MTVILIVQAWVVSFEPVRFLHLEPGSIGFKTEFQYPRRLVALGRNGAHYLFIDTFGQLIGSQLSEETFFITPPSLTQACISLGISTLLRVMLITSLKYQNSRHTRKHAEL